MHACPGQAAHTYRNPACMKGGGTSTNSPATTASCHTILHLSPRKAAHMAERSANADASGPTPSTADGAAPAPGSKHANTSGAHHQHGRPAKRQMLVEKPKERGPDLEAFALLKFKLEPLPAPLSPGALACNKVAVRADDGRRCEAFVASSTDVYSISLSLPTEMTLESGKEGVLVPSRKQDMHMRLLERNAYHRAEVQSLQLAEGVLASVDASGHAVLQVLPAMGGDMDRNHVLELPPATRRECGWAGIALCPRPASADAPASTSGIDLDELEVAVARHMARDVMVYKGGSLVRTLHTVQSPSAIQYTPPIASCNGSLLAIAEEHYVSLWDLRQGEGGGCVHRLSVAQGCPVYAVQWCPVDGGLLGTAGADRAVTLFDCRKWRPQQKWANCVKYPINQMLFSAVNPRFSYVAGLDCECLCGRWDGSTGAGSGNSSSLTGGAVVQGSRAAGPRVQLAGLQGRADDESAPTPGGVSFRADSRWLGLARDAQRDVLAALSLNGQLYIWENVARGC